MDDRGLRPSLMPGADQAAMQMDGRPTRPHFGPLPFSLWDSSRQAYGFARCCGSWVAWSSDGSWAVLSPFETFREEREHCDRNASFGRHHGRVGTLDFPDISR